MISSKHISVSAAVLIVCATVAFSFLYVHIFDEENSPQVPKTAVDLIIYSPHKEDVTHYIIKEFRQRTGLRVKLVRSGTGSLLQMLDAGLSQLEGDVFWGGGIDSLESAKEIFAPFEYKESFILCKDAISSDNYWTGISLMPMVLLYNTELVPKEVAPATWSDLKNPFFTDQVLIANPARSGSAYTMLGNLLSVGDFPNNWNLINDLLSVIGRSGIKSSSADVYTALATREAFVGLSFEDAGLTLKKNNFPINIIYPHEGVVVIPDGIALMKNAHHRNNAILFMEFILSKNVQTVVSEKWNKRSVRLDVEPPFGARKLDTVPQISYDVEYMSKNKKAILGKWEKALMHSR